MRFGPAALMGLACMGLGAPALAETSYSVSHDFAVMVPARDGVAAARAVVASKTAAWEAAKSTLLTKELALENWDAQHKGLPTYGPAVRVGAVQVAPKTIATAPTAPTAPTASQAVPAGERAALVKEVEAAKAAVNAAFVEMNTALAALLQLTKAPDVQLAGMTFIRVGGHGTTGSGGCLLQSGTKKELDLLPQQPVAGPSAPNVCALSVGPDETIVDDANHTLGHKEFPLTAAGTYNDTLATTFAPTSDPTSATATVTIKSWTVDADGMLVIKGVLASSGVAGRWYETSGPTTGATYAFSHAGLRITGGADVSRVLIDWSPDMTAGAGGGSSASTTGGLGGMSHEGQVVTYDPVTLRVVDKAGKTRVAEELLGVRMASKANGRMRFRSGGLAEVGTEEGDLVVSMPGKLTSQRGAARLAVKAGKVAERTASGVLANANLPAVKTVVRAAQAPGPAATPPTTTTPIRLTVAIPTLQTGEKFELRLGGGGGHTR